MKLKKATEAEIRNLTPGSLLITDLDEHISDFSVFKEYDETTKTVVAYDCVTRMSAAGDKEYVRNEADYKDVAIVDINILMQ